LVERVISNAASISAHSFLLFEIVVHLLISGNFGAEDRQEECHGLDKLWKWNVVCIVCMCKNDGALRAVKKLYIRLCAARDREAFFYVLKLGA
jgi:hypothetical protein